MSPLAVTNTKPCELAMELGCEPVVNGELGTTLRLPLEGDESCPRDNNGRTHLATVADVSDAARSHDPGDLDAHCQPSAPRPHSAMDCGNAVRIAWLPMAFTIEITSALNFASRSTIRNRSGCSPYSQTSCSCNSIQSALGLRVKLW